MKHPKTANRAGYLGVFLGWSGAYDWYLGNKKKAIIHAVLAAASLIMVIIAGIILQSQTTLGRLMAAATSKIQASDVLYSLGYLIAAGNTIWGIVEGILTLNRGDKDPVAKASTATVATPSVSVQTSANDTTSATAASPAPTTVVAATPPAKAPMAPATKKKLILGGSIAAGVIILIAAVCIVVALLTRVDYGDTYRVASDLRTKVNSLYQDYGCSRAVDYVDSTWVSERTYNSYVEDCKDVIDGSEELVEKLSETSGVRRNSKISEQFKTFQANFNQAFPDINTIGEKLDLYQAWHTFTVKVDDLTAKSSDADFKSAADVLAKSGNSTMAAYAEGWLEKALAYAHAYQAYWDAPSDDPNRAQLRNDMNNKQSEQRAWVSENRPDVVELVGLEFDGASKMYNSYRTLFSTIAGLYEDNYNFGSGDCTELFDDVVICE